MRGIAIVALLLGGCASRPLPPQEPLPAAPPRPDAPSSKQDVPRYRCDNDVAFTVRFEDDSAIIDAGPQGRQTLDRDAGGVTPSQTVYSSTSMKAQFGLGADGREAQLDSLSPPFVTHCARD